MKFKIVRDKKNNRWLYTYKDESGNFHKKICRNCTTYEDAENYISKLKANYVDKREQFLIKNIAKNMFKPNSEQINRLKQFGKVYDLKTLNQKRHFIELIIIEYGDYYIDTLNFAMVESNLLKDKHSGSWKNSYLETFCSIYDETSWMCSKIVPRPKVQRFIRNSKKSDILTTDELSEFFNKNNWEDFSNFVFFNVVFSCGLRLGEARALKLYQFSFEKKVLVVDGFVKNNLSSERTNYNKGGNINNQKIRIVPIPNNLINLVQQYLVYQNIVDEKQYLFTRENGMPLRQEYLESVFKRQLKKSSVIINNRKLSPHSLRYTYITRMRRFLPKDIVQQIVGHSDYKMTDYYTRFGYEELIVKLKDSIEAVNTIFS